MNFNRDERNLLIYTSVAHSISDAWHILYPSLLFLIALDYPDYFFLGVLANVVIASRAISGLIAGMLCDKYSARALYAFFSVLSAAGCFLALIPGGQVGLAIALFFLGIGIGIYHPVGLANIGRNIRQASTALGIHEMGGIAGHGILPVAVISIGVLMGWKQAFMFAGFISLVPLLTLFLVPRKFDRPIVDESQAPLSPKEIFSVFTQRKVLGIWLTSAFIETSQTGFTTFLPVAIAIIGGLGERTILGLSVTGLYLAFTIVITSPGGLLGGRLGEKFAPEKIIAVLCLLPIPFLLWMGMTAGAVWLALAAIIRIPFSAMSPLISTLIATRLPASTQGKAFAISYSIGPIIASLAALLAGAIAERHGLTWIFPLMAVFLVPASISALLMIGSSKEHAKTRGSSSTPSPPISN